MISPKKLFLFILLIISSSLLAKDYYTFEKSWPLKTNPISISDYVAVTSDDKYIFLLSVNGSIDKLNKEGELIDRFFIKNSCGRNKSEYLDIQADIGGGIYVLVDCASQYFYVKKYNSKGSLLSFKKMLTNSSTYRGELQVINNDIYTMFRVYENSKQFIKIVNHSNNKKYTLDINSLSPTSEKTYIYSKAFCADEDLLYFIIDSDKGDYLFRLDRHNMTVIDKSKTDHLDWVRNCSVYNESLNIYIGYSENSIWKYNYKLNIFTLVGNSDDNPRYSFQSKKTGDIFQLTFGLKVYDSSYNLKLDIGEENQSSGNFGVISDIRLKDNKIYTSDSYYNRIQVFNLNGKFIYKFGQKGKEDGEFLSAGDLQIYNDYLYISDMENYRVQKFNKKGDFITAYYTSNKNKDGDTIYYQPKSININDKDIYFAAYSKLVGISSGEISIPKYNEDKEINKGNASWGGSPFTMHNIGEYHGLMNDIDGNLIFSRRGLIYKLDLNNNVIELTNFVDIASNSGFKNLYEIAEPLDKYALDASGNIYFIIKKVLYKLSRANQTIEAMPNIMFPRKVTGIALTNNKLYVSSESNILVFNKSDRPDKSKAIIIAGGTTLSDPLWDQVQANANHAFHALASQGYTKENINYLNANTDIDLDNNGKADDIDSKPTLENVHKAITDWAADGEDVVIYMIDHGGDKTYQLNETEVLRAEKLKEWLDTLQSKMSGKVTIIYDACSSGTFLSVLGNNTYERTVITSTTDKENASFNDAISFSNLFWSQILNGKSIYEAFTLTSDSISETYDQYPLLDADGNGIANEDNDYSLVAEQYIGSGRTNIGTAPTIEKISNTEVLEGENTATITATGVKDKEGIVSVWGVVTPPYADLDGSGAPLQNLPRFSLLKTSKETYEGSFHGFNQPGTYRIAVYAQDQEGNTSFPLILNIDVENPLSRKAVIVVGLDDNKSVIMPLKQAENAYSVLKNQGYSPESIEFLVADDVGTEGVTRKTSLLSIKNVITKSWAKENTSDIVFYFLGSLRNGKFIVNKTEALAVNQLNQWLDELQNAIKGTMTVIHEGDYSGHIVTNLTAPKNKERIVISSSSISEASQILANGNISFSQFFWNQIRQGSDIALAFQYAQAAMRDYQSPQLNDNGNTTSNEKTDRQLARQHKIGVGILLAADEPKIQQVSPNANLSGESKSLLWVDGIVSTSQIKRVWVVISPPEFNPSLNQTARPYEIDLVKVDETHWQIEHDGFAKNSGSYKIAFYAEDTNNRISQPTIRYIYQSIGEDAYEPNNDFASAKSLLTSTTKPQWHNFHKKNDIDFIRFDVKKTFGQYTIKIDATGSEADPVIKLYNKQHELVKLVDDSGVGELELLYFTPKKNEIYYLEVSPFVNKNIETPLLTSYAVSIFPTSAPIPVKVIGKVTNEDGSPIIGATIKVNTKDFGDNTQTNEDGRYIIKGFVGSYDLSVEAEGYETKKRTLSSKAEEQEIEDFILKVRNDNKPEKPIVTPEKKPIQLGKLPRTKVKHGAQKVAMQVLKIRIPENGAFLYSMSLKGAGTGNEVREIEQVILYHDKNKNRKIDTVDMVLAKSKFSQDNGEIILQLSKPIFFAKGNLQLIVGYDFK